MSSRTISKSAYLKLFLESVWFLLYWSLGKRRDYEEETLRRSLKESPEFWNSKYSEFKIHYADMKELIESYEKKQHITSALQSVLDCAKDFEKPKILEVGFGRAGDLVALKKQLRDVELYGVEPSNASIEIAKEISNSLECDLNLIEGDAYHLPFCDKTFDIVFLSQVFEHMRQPSDALKEQIRVVKNGGYLILGVPQLYHIHTIIKHADMRVRVSKGELGEVDETEYSAKELSDMLVRHGLEVKEIIGRGSLFDNWTWKHMLRFLPPKIPRILKSHLHKHFSISIIITGKKGSR